MLLCILVLIFMEYEKPVFHFLKISRILITCVCVFVLIYHHLSLYVLHQLGIFRNLEKVIRSTPAFHDQENAKSWFPK